MGQHDKVALLQPDTSVRRRRYVYLMMGVIIGSAVCPIAFCMVWSKCTATGAVAGALTGLAAAVCAWLGYTKANYGVVNLDTTGVSFSILRRKLLQARLLQGGAAACPM